MFEKWKPKAQDVEPVDQLPAPLPVLAGEAVELSRFCKDYWDAQRNQDGGVVVPGLELAEREGLFEKQIGQEILELHEAAQAAQTAYLLTTQAAANAPMDRAQFALRELRAALAFLFDDMVDDDEDARLERINAEYDNVHSQDDVASALDVYSTFAQRHREALSGLGGFNPTIIDEAPELAKALRNRSADRLVTTPGSEQKAALDTRNRIVAMLWDRMSKVRSVARFVFRHHPELIRKATSPYERKRRAESKRRSRNDSGTEVTA